MMLFSKKSAHISRAGYDGTSYEVGKIVLCVSEALQRTLSMASYENVEK